MLRKIFVFQLDNAIQRDILLDYNIQIMARSQRVNNKGPTISMRYVNITH